MRSYKVKVYGVNKAFGLSIPARSIVDCLEKLKKQLVKFGMTNEHVCFDLDDVTPA
jgi:hypothetical protein